jgi:AraC-like DNA-binding protein
MAGRASCVLDGIAVSSSSQPMFSEQARYFRPSTLPGVEMLHASFVSHRYAEHLHDTWTVATVDRGAAAFDLEGTTHTAPRGSVFLIPPYAVHTGQSATPGGYRYRVLYLDPLVNAEETGIVLPSHGDRRMPVVLRDHGLTVGLTRLHGSVDMPGHALEQSEMLSGITAAIADLVARNGSVVRLRRDPAVGRAVDFIHERWRDDFTVGDLARVVGISPFHLIRGFERQVGMPPSRYRRALRVLAAQRLLRAGLGPAEVAAQCGFYDQSHLNRHFKTATGVTPGRYADAQA